MNNGQIPPTSQYVLSYNNNDFYSNNQALVDNIFTKIEGSVIKNKNVQSFCKDKNSNSLFYRRNQCSGVVNIENVSEPKKKCAVLNELCKNNENYSKLKELQTTHYASNGRYNDTTQYYNTEMIKSVNLGIGIIGLSFIIYTIY